MSGQFFLGHDGRFHDLSNLGEVCVLWSPEGNAFENIEARAYVRILCEGMRLAA